MRLLLLIAVLLLCACTKTEIQYVEVEREPITCIDDIKTPLDMAKCLTIYKQKY
jgi:hypothetical protein